VTYFRDLTNAGLKYRMIISELKQCPGGAA
jgi:hypothetical protein